jgi:hypothetical protein
MIINCKVATFKIVDKQKMVPVQMSQ